MSGNAEFVLAAARRQLDALQKFYEARSQAAGEAIAEVTQQMRDDGKLDKIASLYPSLADGKWFALPSHAADRVASTKKRLVQIQNLGRHSRLDLPGVDRDFSKPVEQFLQQLSVVKGVNDVDLEAHRLVEALPTQVKTFWDSLAGGVATEEASRAFTGFLEELHEDLRVATERLRETNPPEASNGPGVDPAYIEAVDRRSGEWQAQLTELIVAATVKEMPSVKTARQAIGRDQLPGRTAGASAHINPYGEVLRTDEKIKDLAAKRLEWEDTTKALEAWEELAAALPEAWGKYLSGPNGQSLRHAFGVKEGEMTQQEFVEQISAAHTGQEMTGVERVIGRRLQPASGMSL